MSDIYYLKNGTGAEIVIDDSGIVIADAQSITIDINDIDGYLTDGMIAALDSDPNLGLILSTTDVGTTSGDFPKDIAIERLTLKTRWKPSKADFASLPTVGNEDGDIRLILDTGIIYAWNQGNTSWDQTSSTFSLTVEEYDGSPSGSDVEKLVFVEPEDDVYINIENGATVAYIGPPETPNPLGGEALTIVGSTLVTGRLSQSNINYEGAAGDLVNYITDDGLFYLSTPSTSDSCDYGDKGVVTVFLNGTELVTVDLEANFDELNRETSQTIANYDTAGTGDPILNGIADFTGLSAGKGSLEIVSVEKYNNFRFYQKWIAKINITDATALRQGYNEIYMTHTLDAAYGGTQTSNTFKVFLDTDIGADPTVSIPTVTEAVPVFKYLSGVKYYDAGSTWQIDVSVLDGFDNVYHSTDAPLEMYGWPGMSTIAIPYTDLTVTGVSTPPDLTETMVVANYDIVQTVNQMSTDAQITARPRDPYGVYSPAISTSANILIWSYGSASTELIEHFRDEDYRLPVAAYDTIPGVITSQWNSTLSLDTYDDGAGLQLYLDELYFPTLNFSTYMPAANPDYSLIAAEVDKTYIRAMRDTSTSHASGTLRLEGITKTQLYNRDVRVWIKAPTQTGWLDLTRDYNFSSFTGIDEDACWVDRDVQSNSDFKFTIGTNYTVNSGHMVIVKIQYPGNTAPRISYMAITNW